MDSILKRQLRMLSVDELQRLLDENAEKIERMESEGNREKIDRLNQKCSAITSELHDRLVIERDHTYRPTTLMAKLRKLMNINIF